MLFTLRRALFVGGGGAVAALCACALHKKRSKEHHAGKGRERTLVEPETGGVLCAVTGLVRGVSTTGEDTTTGQRCCEGGVGLAGTGTVGSALCYWWSSSSESRDEEITEGNEEQQKKDGGNSNSAMGRKGGETAEVRSLADGYWPSKDGKSLVPEFVTPTPQQRADIQRVALEKNIFVGPLVGPSSAETEPFFRLERNLFQVRDLLPSIFRKGRMERPLFNTNDHDDILSWLSGRAFFLQNGQLGGSCGIASATVIGHKGMGKTLCLKTFAQLSQLLWPDVVVVYFSFDNAMEEHFEDPDFISKLSMAALDRNGVDVQKYHGVFPRPGLSALLRVLDGEEKKIMLILDEIEHVFRKVSVAREEILRTIASFGGSMDGLISVVVTGSSTHLAALVKGVAYASDHAVEKYPLAKRMIDMNGEKLLPLRLSPSLPHDVGKVEKMLLSSLEARFTPEIVRRLQKSIEQSLKEMGLKLNDDGDMLVLIDEPGVVEEGFVQRMKALFSRKTRRGIAIPDELRGLFSPLQESGDAVEDDKMLQGYLEQVVRGLAPFITFYFGSGARQIDSLVSSLVLKGQKTPPKVEYQPQSHDHLFDAIFRALKKKNAKLLQEVERRGGQSLMDLIFYLSTREWCERFEGATLADIREEVVKDAFLRQRYAQAITDKGGDDFHLNMKMLRDDIGALCDEGVIRKQQKSMRVNDMLVFPVSMFQLIESVDSVSMSNVQGLFADPLKPLTTLGRSGWNGVIDGVSRFTSELV